MRGSRGGGGGGGAGAGPPPARGRGGGRGGAGVVARHDPAASRLDDVVAEVLTHDPVGVYVASAGNPCLLAVQALRDAGSLVPIMLPSVCSSPRAYVEPLGEQAQGLSVMLGSATSRDGPLTDSTLARAAAEIAGDGDPFPLPFPLDDDWLAAWYAVEVVKIAAELDGGVTRSNIVLAQWSFEGRHPYAAGPVVASWPGSSLVHTPALLEYDLAARRWELPTE